MAMSGWGLKPILKVCLWLSPVSLAHPVPPVNRSPSGHPAPIEISFMFEDDLVEVLLQQFVGEIDEELPAERPFGPAWDRDSGSGQVGKKTVMKHQKARSEWRPF